MKKNISAIILIAGTIVLWFLKTKYPQWDLEKIFLSAVIISVSFLFFRVFLESVFSQKVLAKKARYTLKKITSVLHIFVTVIIVMRIWIPDGATLAAVYGFVAAAIAFSIQDVFKNLVGGIMIFLKGIYKVGDRIKINNIAGDVVDIDIWYTYILEIQGWVAGDQPTGRITTVPNALVISGEIANYTDDHQFIWDEIFIPITFESDWRKAEKIIQEVMNRHTKDLAKTAEKDILKLEQKYFLTTSNVSSNVYVQITDNWISLYGRYIAATRERRTLNSHINRNILEAFEKEPNITIASATMTVTTIQQK